MSRRLPLRTQVLLLVIGAVALVVLTTAAASTVALRSYLFDRVDDDLVATARALQAPGGQDGLAGGADGGRRAGRGGPRGPVPRQFLVARYSEDGTLYAAAGIAIDDETGPALPDEDKLPRGAFTVDDRRGDDQWRAVATTLDDGSRVVVALPLGDIDDTVSQLLVINAAAGLVALVAAGLLGFVGVRRSLRPLVAVGTTAEAIAAGDLSVRVPDADARTEVGGLAASFNSMVDRFESAYRAQQASESAARTSEDRMRRFVGDASHELRTPLTSIRGFAELFRQGAVADPDSLARIMRRIEDEAARMGLLVEDLLLLARLDQQRPLERSKVDLLTVAADVVHDAQTVHAGHVVRLLPPPEAEPLVVLGDDARLRQVLGNLVTNASTHTPAGTTVEVALRREADEVVVDVSDDGPGMPPEVAARVFERFYRADASRTRAVNPTTGSGLGLSIVSALVAAHGGRVTVDSLEGRGTTFSVRLTAA